MRGRKRARWEWKSAEVVEKKGRKERGYPTPCVTAKSAEVLEYTGVAGRRGGKECAGI